MDDLAEMLQTAKEMFSRSRLYGREHSVTFVDLPDGGPAWVVHVGPKAVGWIREQSRDVYGSGGGRAYHVTFTHGYGEVLRKSATTFDDAINILIELAKI